MPGIRECEVQKLSEGKRKEETRERRHASFSESAEARILALAVIKVIWHHRLGSFSKKITIASH